MHKTEDGRKRCRRKRHDGEPCSNWAMNDAEFCYVHSFSRWRGIPILKNATTHVSLVIGILATCLFYYLGGLDVQREGEATRNAVKEGDSQIIEEIRRLSASMEDELSQFYTSGFILFGVSRTELVIPKESRLSSDWTFDWSGAKIIDRTASGFVVRFPDMTYLPREFRFTGLTVTFRVSDPVGKVVELPVEMGMPYHICVEILERNAQGWIFVIGFVPV